MRCPINCKRLRAPPRQPGRPQDRKGGKRVSQSKEEGQRGQGEGVGWGGGVGAVLRHSLYKPPQTGPSTASVCSSSKRLGGVPQGGGGGGVRIAWGAVGSGGRRPDPGLLVPDASRQEAEANIKEIEFCLWQYRGPGRHKDGIREKN